MQCACKELKLVAGLIFSEVFEVGGIGQGLVIKAAASSSCLLLQASKGGKADEKEEGEDQTVI